MTMLRILIVFLLFSCLASCASMAPPSTAVNENQAWDARAKTLAAVQTWDIKGVIAVHKLNDAWTANLKWHQQQQNYQIALFGPLGSNTYELTGQPGRVELAAANGQHFSATSPEALLRQQAGWELPVSNLYYWIRGLPVPNLPSETRFDAYHHLVELKQQGWTVQFLRYTAVNHVDVPNKIFLENAELKVKIAISQWQL